MTASSAGDASRRPGVPAEERPPGLVTAGCARCGTITFMPITSGSRLGPYEIVAPIGAGGMGEVFEGRDVRLNRRVAVKILPPEFAEDATFRARFQREARAISALSHPNICAIYDVGHEDGTDFLVLEYLEGEPLSRRLESGPLPSDRVLQYGAQMAEALAEAHQRGIIHRDLKPSNVVLTKSGIKLLDFGLATNAPRLPDASGTTVQRSLTQEGAIVGTFGYMAPEQLEGRDTDSRTDIFGLGAVLYQMATGRRPFDAPTTAGLIAAVMSSEPVPPSALQPSILPALERVILKCLRRDPAERWQSARDLADELRWIRGTATNRDKPQIPLAARRWPLVATLALVIVMISAIAYWRTRGSHAVSGPPVIVLMDSTNPERIYSSVTRANGGTNADDLTNILRDLPVTLVKENTSAFWNREDQVLKERPTLITIHRGAFATSASVLSDKAMFNYAFQLGEKKVQLFIGYAGLANPSTKFIVYSRSWDNIGGWKPWVTEVENRFPHVRGRVIAIDVTGSPEPSFRDPHMAAQIRRLAMDAVGLKK